MVMRSHAELVDTDRRDEHPFRTSPAIRRAGSSLCSGATLKPYLFRRRLSHRSLIARRPRADTSSNSSWSGGGVWSICSSVHRPNLASDRSGRTGSCLLLPCIRPPPDPERSASAASRSNCKRRRSSHRFLVHRRPLSRASSHSPWSGGGLWSSNSSSASATTSGFVCSALVSVRTCFHPSPGRIEPGSSTLRPCFTASRHLAVAACRRHAFSPVTTQTRARSRSSIRRPRRRKPPPSSETSVAARARRCRGKLGAACALPAFTANRRACG